MVLRRDDDPAGDAPARPDRVLAPGPARVVLVALLVLVVGAGVLLGGAEPAVEPLLGRLDAPAGAMASAPPPAQELRQAWEVDASRPGQAFASPGGRTVAPGLALLDDGGVLDVATGRVVAGLPGDAGVGAGRAALLGADEVVVLDALDGRVLERIALPDELHGGNHAVATHVLDTAVTLSLPARGGGPGRDVVLLGSDGRVRAELADAEVVDVTGDRFVLVARGASGLRGQRAWRLLDATDGRTLLDLDDDPAGPPVLLGERVVVATGDGVVAVDPVGGGVEELDLPRSSVLLGAIDDGLVIAVGASAGPLWAVAVTNEEGRIIGVVADLSATSADQVRRRAVVTGEVVVVARERSVRATEVRTGVDRSFTVDGVVELVEVAGYAVVVGEDGGVPVVEGLAATTVLDPTDGTIRWRRPVDGPVLVPRLVLGGELVLTHPGALGPDDGIGPVVRLDPRTGEVRSRAPATSGQLGGAGPVVRGTALVDGRVVRVAHGRAAGGDTLVRIGDDPVRRVTATQDAPGALAGVVDGQLVLQRLRSVDGRDELLGLDLVPLAGGDVLRPDLEDAGRVVALGEGLVLLVDDAGVLTALDVASGEVRWQVDDAPGTVGPVTAGRVVRVDAGTVHLHDAADGALVATLGADAVVSANLAAGGLLVGLTVDGRLAAHRLADGAPAWDVDVDAAGASVLVAAGDHVLVGTRDGRVVEVDADGRVVRDLVAGVGTVRGLALVDDTLAVLVDGVLRGFRTDGSGLAESDLVEVPDLP